MIQEKCKHDWVITFFGESGFKQCKKCRTLTEWDW